MDTTSGRPPELRVEVAGVQIRIEHDVTTRVRLDAAYDSFRAADGPFFARAEAPFRFRLRPPPMPMLDPSRVLFDTHFHWSAFDVEGCPAIVHAAADALDTLSEVILIPPCAEDGEVPPTGAEQIGEIVHVGAGRPAAAIDPLEHPMGQLLWRELLPRREGILLHAAGLVVDGRALLFLGHSGAGKSTLLRQFPAVGLLRLSDDRIVVRWMEAAPEPGWWAFGTPWPGEDGIIDPRGAPVGAMFLLEHASGNALHALTGAAAAAEVMARTHLPYWSRDGIVRSVAVAHRLVTQVPLFRFQFVPGPDAARFILARPFSSQIDYPPRP